MTPRSVLVIGAGVGGLTAAIHLAARGFHVTLLEKNAQPGGRCGRLERQGFRFDTGPTLFVMPLLYEAEFRAMGTSTREQLDLDQVDPTYRLVFDDGARLSLTSDMAAMRRQLNAMEPGSFRGLQRYLHEGAQHYRLVVDEIVNRDLRSMSALVRPRSVSLLLGLHPFINHYGGMARYFDDPRLKAAFTFQDIYMGLSPFQAPITYSLMPYSELAHGVWYPRGGMYSIVEALVNLAKAAGVEFAFNSAVQHIDTNGSRARGVRLADGSSVRGDVILANADLPYVYEDLLPADKAARLLAGKQFSCSVISFFWGVDRVYEELGAHTLFLADDYRQNFRAIKDELRLPDNPSLYIHAPVRLDPAMAPPGQDTLIAIVPVGHMSGNGDQDWPATVALARRHVFRRLRLLGIHDLESHIIFERIYSPPEWKERFNLMKGSTHGLAHTLTQMAFLRPSNRHHQYRNLYFVGASTHPGTGTPTAMVSGRLAAARILDEQ